VIITKIVIHFLTEKDSLLFNNKSKEEKGFKCESCPEFISSEITMKSRGSCKKKDNKLVRKYDINWCHPQLKNYCRSCGKLEKLDRIEVEKHTSTGVSKVTTFLCSSCLENIKKEELKCIKEKEKCVRCRKR